MKILVTGGAGFIGSTVVKLAIARGHSLVNLDALTYAASLESLDSVAGHPRYHFIKGDIRDGELLAQIFAEQQPEAVLHLAAESHVDRSIDSPAAFIDSNILGTFQLLHAARRYWLTEASQSSSAFTMSLRTRSLASWVAAVASPKPLLMRRARLTRPLKRRPTIWCAPGTRPTACQYC